MAVAAPVAGCNSDENDKRVDETDSGVHTTRNTELTEAGDTDTREEDWSKPNSIEQMKQQYIGPDGEHNETVRTVNNVMKEEYGVTEDAAGYGGALMQEEGRETLSFFDDDDVDAIGERYLATIGIRTDRHGPYADLHALEEEGKLNYGKPVREEIDTLLAHYVADTLEGVPYNPFGEFVVTQREADQDAISRIRYALQGVEAGIVMLDLNNHGEDDNLDYASNEVYGSGGSWSRKKMKQLVTDVVEI